MLIGSSDEEDDADDAVPEKVKDSESEEVLVKLSGENSTFYLDHGYTILSSKLKI
jgi:hypothetical protein